MCNHCDLHNARAAHQRDLAAKAHDGYVRESHLKLAELHEARISEYQALHGGPAMMAPLRESREQGFI